MAYFDTYKVLKNLITNESYALVCCDSSLDDFKTGYHAVVNTPLTNVGVDTELESLPFFEVSHLFFFASHLFCILTVIYTTSY